eukprot:g2321.t1
MKKSSMKPGDALVLTKRLGISKRCLLPTRALRTCFMCSQSQLEATVELSKVPLYEGALETMAMGIESSLQVANVRLRRAVKSTEEVRARAAYPLLFDPQTSGGLLASLPKVAAESCVRELLAAGLEATVIGEVTGPASELEMITALDLALKTFAFGLFPRWTNDELPCKLHSYTCVASPTEIPGAPGFTTLSGGQDGCLGLTPEGDVHRWVAKAGCARGFTMEWSLSILKDEVGQRLQLREVALSSGPVPDIRRPSFGEDPAVAAVALMDSGEVFASQAWYDEGQDGTMVCPDWRLVPSLQSVLVVSVACGGGYAMALTAGGGLMAWGSSLCGAMGLGAASHVSEPTLVQGELARCRVAVRLPGSSCTALASRRPMARGAVAADVQRHSEAIFFEATLRLHGCSRTPSAWERRRKLDAFAAAPSIQPACARKGMCTCGDWTYGKMDLRSVMGPGLCHTSGLRGPWWPFAAVPTSWCALRRSSCWAAVRRAPTGIEDLRSRGGHPTCRRNARRSRSTTAAWSVSWSEAYNGVSSKSSARNEREVSRLGGPG